MDLSKYNKIYFIGIGGISVSAAADLFLHFKKQVLGSDSLESEITKKFKYKKGIDVFIEHNPQNIKSDIDLVIYSDAVPFDNPERVRARELSIPEMSVFKFWGEYSKNKKVIAISGTNGKSTTTAMIGHILVEAGLDPTVVVGTKVLDWDSNIRVGGSDILVIESDEYAGHMHEINPFIAVITNISEDHLDYYKDLDDIVNNFSKWLSNIKESGGVVINDKDDASMRVKVSSPNLVFFGGKTFNSIRASGVVELTLENGWDGEVRFNIVDNNKDYGLVSLRLPGRYNIENALAAFRAACLLKIPPKKILKSLSSFKGTWRRFEIVGFYKKSMVVSDYGHHPSAVKAVLLAARSWYTNKKIVLVFQPHHHNRTKKLFKDFVKCFDQADELIVSEIYDVVGRENMEDQKISSKDLVEAIKIHLDEFENKNFLNSKTSLCRAPKLLSKKVHYAENLLKAEETAKESIMEGDVLIFMGAGDIDTIARKFVN